MILVLHQTLRELTTKIFAKMGATDYEATVVANHLVDADLAGVDSHGVIRVPEYVDKILGTSPTHFRIVPNSRITVERESPTTVAVDGGSGFGQVVARKVMTLAIEKAKSSGVCLATAKHLDHVGRLAEYTTMAANEGMIAMMFVKNPPALRPTGGTAKLIGNDPMSYAIPTGRSGEPIVFDIAMSVAAGGKMRLAIDKGDLIPEGWIVDRFGNPTRDPRDYFERGGSMLPMSEHKGYGLAVMTEVLAGILSGGGALTELNTNNAVFIVVFRIDSFMPLDEFKAKVDQLIKKIKNSPKKPSVQEIYLPGEIELQTREKRLREGIPLPEKTWENIQAIVKKLGIEN
jgi:LDH2 family malate/lactate/ureidoglycolate dehydrogenase